MTSGKKRILVVEDEPDVCRILAYRLEKAGFEVLTSRDGEDGLRKVREQKPDILILDLMLPRMRGEEVCKAVRADQNERVRGIPILILTAKDSLGENTSEKKIAGADAYMSKPYDFDRLLAEINKY